MLKFPPYRRIWRVMMMLSICSTVSLLTSRLSKRLSIHTHVPLPDWAFSEASLIPSLIPPKIWQIHLKPDIQLATIVDTPSWISKNPDYIYRLLSTPGAEAFVATHFPEHLDIFQSIKNTGAKSDLLRYMLLAVEGGTYTDLDTVAIQPIDYWVPPRYRDRARVLIGIEYDQRDDPHLWLEVYHTVQFCQWTMAAAPGHRVFTNMIQRSVDSLRSLEQQYNLPLSNITLHNLDILNSTGPAAWTDVVFEELKLADPSITSLRNFSRLEEPTLYDDILLLPLDAFRMSQSNLGTLRWEIPKTALVKHNFRGSWKQDKYLTSKSWYMDWLAV
jgi:alpha 1,6-mannosyltransferase